MVDRHDLRTDTRASIRAVIDDGPVEVVGWVVASDTDRLRLRTRTGERELPWSQITVCRSVGVPRGRDPLRTPSAELDRLAQAAGLHGRKLVARLSHLLDGRDPVTPTGAGVLLDGEWAVTSGEALLAQAWWAAQADARNLLVVTDDDEVEGLLAFGFTEVGPADGSAP